MWISQWYTIMAQSKLFPMKVRYNPESLAKILSLKYEVGLNGFTVTMGT